jgi:hypothetical protein
MPKIFSPRFVLPVDNFIRLPRATIDWESSSLIEYSRQTFNGYVASFDQKTSSHWIWKSLLWMRILPNAFLGLPSSINSINFARWHSGISKETTSEQSRFLFWWSQYLHRLHWALMDTERMGRWCGESSVTDDRPNKYSSSDFRYQ